MKKTFLLSIIFIVLSIVKASAQEFYIRAGAGFIAQSGKTEFNNADPNGLTQIQQSTDITIDANGVTRVRSLNGTLGAGVKFNLTGGYMFNKNIGAELGVNYFQGAETTIGKLTSPQLQSESRAYIRGVDLIPALYFTTDYPKINPYLRVGAILTGAGKLFIETDANQTNGGGEGTDIAVAAKTEVKSKFSVGFVGAVGITYPISNKVQLFGEIEFKNFSIKSKSAQIIAYSTRANSENGQSTLVPGEQLADLPVSEKEFIFSDDFTQSSPQDENQPRRIPTQYVNTGGVGINIGIRYSLGE